MANSANEKAIKRIPTPEETSQRAKREIVRDAMAGTVPRDCRSFSSLHDHYHGDHGGFFANVVIDPLIAHFGGWDLDKNMPDGFVKHVTQAQGSVTQWLLGGGLEKECLPPGWKLADDYTKATFNKWGDKPYDALYMLSVGPSAGVPLCDLTVLQNGVKFQAVHGTSRMPELDDSPKEAAERAVGWALANGWSEDVVRAAQWPAQAAIDAQSLATLPVSVQGGLAITQSGEYVNLLKIQALCNATFQDTGDNEIGEAANELSKLTGLWQGPHGDWFLNADEQALRPVKISSAQLGVRSTAQKDGISQPSAKSTQKLVVVMEGGEVAGVIGDGGDLSVAIVQYLDRNEESNVAVLIPQDDGKYAKASASIVEVEHAPERTALMHAIAVNGPTPELARVVNSGSFSGQVLAITDGIVTQRTNRQGHVVLHDSSLLTKPVAVGQIVDVTYRGGRALVSGPGIGTGLDR